MDIKGKDQDDFKDFSLALGGPLYQFYLRTRLLEPPFKRSKRRVVIICLFAWLPLLLLSILGGDAFSGVKVPFLLDIDAHVRFLGSLALLVAADLFVHERLRIIVPQFIEHDIVEPEDKTKFKHIIESAIKLRNSVVVELLLIVLAFTCGHWIWKQFMSLGGATWYAATFNNQINLTPAGYWYVFVSLPLFQFIGLRWYFRILIWYRFLWQVSKLPLHFNPLHPDRAGGLCFLMGSLFAFAPILLAHTALLSGIIANRIWHQGATLREFELEIMGAVIFMTLIVIIPLTFFVFKLAKSKRIGLREYSLTASQYVNDFRRKWIYADSKNKEELLGTTDIQSLADLSNSYNIVRDMRLVPFGHRTVISLALLIAVPLAPLLLMVIPFEEMLKRLLTVLF